MPLKVELKPHEKIVIGDSLITNGDMRATLSIQGDAPILREKDILKPGTNFTPAQSIYFVVQMMYLDHNVDKHIATYQQLFVDYKEAAPSAEAVLSAVNNHILTGELYKALKEAKKLLTHEQERLKHVSGPSGI